MKKGLYWYIFLAFLIYYATMYYNDEFKQEYWNTIYILLGIGFTGWLLL